MNHTINDEPELDRQLQRLFDGESSHAQRSQLVQLAEQTPGLWRRIGIGLLEEQALQLNRSSFAGAESNRLTSSLIQAPRSESAHDTVDKIQITSAASSLPTKPSANLSMMMVLAASVSLLILGFAIGRSPWRTNSESLLTENQPPFDRIQIASNPTSAVDPPEIPPRVDPTADKLAGKLAGNPSSLRLISTGSQGENTFEMPLIEVDDVNEETVLGQPTQWLQGLQRDLARRGVMLEYEAALLDSDLPDGRKVFVPIREFKLTSLGY
jgi:hypothetical protein